MKKTLTDKLIELNIKLLNIPILIDFWADWCVPCKLLNNTINEIKNIFKKKLKILKVNININYYSAEKFSIKNVPTIIIVKNRFIIKKKTGLINKNYIKKILKKLI